MLRPLVTTLMFSILQTCVPAYRLPVFDAVAAELGEEFRVVAGDRFFDPSIRTVAQGRPWFQACNNRFLAGNRLLWQSGSAMRELAWGPLVVEANPRCLRTWLLLLQARLRGGPTAVWGHALGRGVGPQKMAASRRAMFGLADTIICYCYAEQEPLQELFPDKRILVAGNSTVHIEECCPLEAPPEKRNSVLFLGRLVEAKKPLLLLGALQILRAQGQKISAVFVGDGPERSKCERFAREAGLAGVVFAGEQFDRAKIREMAADCFAVTSPGYVGLSVLDALSMGLPVAFSRDEPNCPEVEVLQAGKNAVVFERDASDSLADVLLRLHRERIDWLARSGQFCDVLRGKYSIERMAAQFVNFFRAANKREAATC
jgi:glycosyltransferase involved in cell wall biosynthesis